VLSILEKGMLMSEARGDEDTLLLQLKRSNDILCVSGLRRSSYDQFIGTRKVPAEKCFVRRVWMPTTRHSAPVGVECFEWNHAEIRDAALRLEGFSKTESVGPRSMRYLVARQTCDGDFSACKNLPSVKHEGKQSRIPSTESSKSQGMGCLRSPRLE